MEGFSGTAGSFTLGSFCFLGFGSFFGFPFFLPFPVSETADNGKKKKRERKPKKEKKVKEKKPKKKRGEAAEAPADGAALEGAQDLGVPEKKKGLFSKLFSALTEEDETSAADENQAIMQELAEEDLKEAGKKKKLKKGKKPADSKKRSAIYFS